MTVMPPGWRPRLPNFAMNVAIPILYRRSDFAVNVVSKDCMFKQVKTSHCDIMYVTTKFNIINNIVIDQRGDVTNIVYTL